MKVAIGVVAYLVWMLVVARWAYRQRHCIVTYHDVGASILTAIMWPIWGICVYADIRQVNLRCGWVQRLLEWRNPDSVNAEKESK